MARKTVSVSDLSGEEISDGQGATVTINFRDASVRANSALPAS